MRRAQNFLTPNVLKTLYFAFIRSHLNYCPIILSSISQQIFDQIKLIQKKAIRIITRSSYTAHTEPLFARLQILPYELILKQAKLLFMHSIEYDYAPPSFRGIWTKNYVNHGDRPLRKADDYMLPNPRTELLKNPLSMHVLWNGIT
jgi:hypothetical protein